MRDSDMISMFNVTTKQLHAKIKCKVPTVELTVTTGYFDLLSLIGGKTRVKIEGA